MITRRWWVNVWTPGVAGGFAWSFEFNYQAFAKAQEHKKQYPSDHVLVSYYGEEETVDYVIDEA